MTNQDKFKATAQVLEDTGVAAYAGQGPNIVDSPETEKAVLKAVTATGCIKG